MDIKHYMERNAFKEYIFECTWPETQGNIWENKKEKEIIEFVHNIFYHLDFIRDKIRVWREGRLALQYNTANVKLNIAIIFN